MTGSSTRPGSPPAAAAPTPADAVGETYLVRTLGGPLPATRLFDADKIPWPPPDELPVPGCQGRYVKVGQSDITDEEIREMSHVVRGAEYEWRRGEGGPEAGHVH